MEASVSTDFTRQAISANVKATKGWLKFLGILSIIGGGLYALTLVGIVVAWMPIWLGIIMVQAGSRAQEYVERGDPKALAGYTGKIKTLFAIMGILTIISLAVGVIGGIIALVLGVFTGSMLPAMLENLNNLEY